MWSLGGINKFIVLTILIESTTGIPKFRNTNELLNVKFRFRFNCILNFKFSSI